MTDEFKKSDEEAAEKYVCRTGDFKYDDQPTSITIESRKAFLAGIAHERKASAEREKRFKEVIEEDEL